MAIGDPVQWIVMLVLIFGVIAGIVYIAFRLLRLMSKAERYLDEKAKETKPASS
jgi:hypothetical protein